MTLQVEFTWLIGLLLAFFGSVFAFGKMLMNQFDRRLDERFKTQDESRKESKEHWEARFNQLESLTRKTEHDVQTLRTELPSEYVRREDWIRFSVSIDQKIDTIHRLLDGIREKLYA